VAENDEIRAWFRSRIPQNLYEGAPEISSDREEILVIGRIGEPKLPADADEVTLAAARWGWINQHREDTRRARVQIAREAEQRFGRKVSWGVRVGGDEAIFTNLNLPVMTRLRMPERQVLDRLVDAGVAKNRSHALAWCVRLVGEHQQQWLDDLKVALTKVEEVREAGPRL
jgi:hypothetical protein